MPTPACLRYVKGLKWWSLKHSNIIWTQCFVLLYLFILFNLYFITVIFFLEKKEREWVSSESRRERMTKKTEMTLQRPCRKPSLKETPCMLWVIAKSGRKDSMNFCKQFFSPWGRSGFHRQNKCRNCYLFCLALEANLLVRVSFCQNSIVSVYQCCLSPSGKTSEEPSNSWQRTHLP